MFITKDDLTTSLYPEIAQAIARYSDAILNMKFATAESEIEGYLSTRYLIRPELEKTGTDRNTWLLNIGLDLAIYHLYANPESVPAHRTKRYEQAIKILELMMKGSVALPGVDAAPVTPISVATGQIAFGSNPRRGRWN